MDKQKRIRLSTQSYLVMYRATLNGVVMEGSKTINAPSEELAKAMFLHFLPNFIAAREDCPPHTDDDLIEVDYGAVLEDNPNKTKTM